MGTSPEGAGRAESLVRARAAARSASLLDGMAVEDLVPLRTGQRLVPGLHARVAVGDAGHVEPGPYLVVLGQQAVGVGDERRAGRLSPQPTDTWEMAEPDERAASSARVRSSSLRALSTESGSVRSPGPWKEPGPRATVRTPGPPWRATAAAAWAAATSPGSLRSAVCANPVVSPSTTRIPAPPRAARGELLDPAVIEHGRGRHGVLGENLRHVTTPDQSGGEHAFEHVRVYKSSVGHGGIVIVVPDRSSDPQPAAGHGPHAGLSAQLELTVA